MELSDDEVGAVAGIEGLVREAWESALPGRTIGPDDDFLDVGGDSLVAADICLRLGDDLGIAVNISELLAYPSVASFAEYLVRELPLRNGLICGIGCAGLPAPDAVKP